jgi:hypothetical protein
MFCHSIEEAADEDTLMKRELQQQEQAYDPEIDLVSLDDGALTRDTLQ